MCVFAVELWTYIELFRSTAETKLNEATTHKYVQQQILDARNEIHKSNISEAREHCVIQSKHTETSLVHVQIDECWRSVCAYND